jgi:hypothetical protein
MLKVMFSLPVTGQTRNDRDISKKDSLLLDKFWKDFKKSIKHRDKADLTQLFKFPFYCSPCKDYVASTVSFNATVKVTKKLFQDSVFKLFYDLPNRNKLTRKTLEK